ncbi:MAG: hypothetical protein J4F35_08220, partial [Candidatus Latescibacteria bacterium]|nr:hypothetical protein [Candidatus Latescibacterota bacterium]
MVPSWPLVDNKGARGPFYHGWNKIHYDSEKPEDYPKSDIPYAAFHNFPIVGDVRWRGEIALLGDIVVFPGATLTIEPGTVIQFAAGVDAHKFSVGREDQAELFVYGTLTTGSDTEDWTAADSIFFQRHGASGPSAAWGGVHVMAGGRTLLNAYTRLSDTRRGKPTNLTAAPGEEPGTVVLAWDQ